LVSDENIVRAGEEDGELGEYRRKLHRFLQTSSSYSPEKLLVLLRYDSMHEERAILLGRLKRHEQALAIYTNVLRDYKEAENYCKINYDRQDPENSKVYLILLRMYTNPPDSSILGLMQSDIYRAQPNQNEAIRILKEHANAIDTEEAISLLPDDYTLKSVWHALEAVLQATHDKRIAVCLCCWRV
uniref:Vam6/Vps39-like protein (inferred by orthology to a human protein) n=1 Tax=Anisakis simplex TaxID=6269 RepID=A0A0M3J823_ANISI